MLTFIPPHGYHGVKGKRLSEKPEYAIIGGGPAGAAAAYTLSKAGYKVTVYDSAPRLGLKPCGRGMPNIGHLPFPIPKESILREIRGATLYVDGERVFDVEEGLSGVIVDKSVMLEALITDSGAELVKKAYYKIGKKHVRIGGNYVEVNRGLFAAGHGYYSDEKINAFQYRVKNRSFEDMDKLIIYFDTKLIGYYYIFPSHSDEADVGVGGYADFLELKSRLDKFMKENEHVNGSKILRHEGAQIAVGGVRLKLIDNLPAIGETAGYVLPLTGEGIRPSMISGHTAAQALLNGGKVTESLHKMPMTKSVNLQRKILERVKKMKPTRRAELLKSIPPSVHAMIALGEINRLELAKALINKPSLLAKILGLL